MKIVLDHLGDYAGGAWVTVQLTLLSFAIAFVIGVVVATFRVAPIPPLRLAGAVWVETLRNTPLAVLIYLFFFGLTKAGINYSGFTSAIIVLSTYTSTFVAETVRSGINTVARGQAEAARAIGLTFRQLLGLVVLPQALRSVVAPLSSVFIALIKNSAIASIIAVEDLTGVTDGLITRFEQPIPIFLGAVIVYVALAVPAGLVLGVLERRVAVRR
jgi:glutamate transport system permease protein